MASDGTVVEGGGEEKGGREGGSLHEKKTEEGPPWHCTSLALGQACTLLPGHRLRINPLPGPYSALQISTRQQIQSPPLHLLLCNGANGKPGGVARFSGMQWADYAQTKQEREGESLQKYLGEELALLPGTGARNNLQRETQQQQGSQCWQNAIATHCSRDLSCVVTLTASWWCLNHIFLHLQCNKQLYHKGLLGLATKP
ncbi:hypothetical protein L345_12215, partial [Ophiophagus hannah]